jgi:hypothetical protein
MGEADVAILQGRLADAERLLAAASGMLREANLSPEHVLNTREYMTRAALLDAQDRKAEARAELTRAVSNYEAQHCCRAHVALALAHRSELALDEGDLASAADDAARAVKLAPSRDSENYSRFTGSAWLAEGRVRETQRRLREARDAYAIAAVQLAGALGEGHSDTLRAREAISRAARLLSDKGSSTNNYN